MKIYYSSRLLPLGDREETDEELKKRMVDHLSQLEANPVKKEDNQDVDSFLQDFRITRSLIPLGEGEIVILRTFTGEMEMSDAHKHFIVQKETFN